MTSVQSPRGAGAAPWEKSQQASSHGPDRKEDSIGTKNSVPGEQSTWRKGHDGETLLSFKRVTNQQAKHLRSGKEKWMSVCTQALRYTHTHTHTHTLTRTHTRTRTRWGQGLTPHGASVGPGRRTSGEFVAWSGVLFCAFHAFSDAGVPLPQAVRRQEVSVMGNEPQGEPGVGQPAGERAGIQEPALHPGPALTLTPCRSRGYHCPCVTLLWETVTTGKSQTVGSAETTYNDGFQSSIRVLKDMTHTHTGCPKYRRVFSKN